MANKTVQRLQAEAEADAQVSELQAQPRVTRLEGEDLGTLRDAGLGASPVKATTNGADNFVTLYHAYDGRVWSGPMYMLGGPNGRLTLRFPTNDNSIPRQHRGKQVWLTDPPPADEQYRPFLCLLSPDQPDDVKAEMRAAGFRSDCSKPNGFFTKFEADEHFRKKHPRRWEAYQRHLTRAQQTESTDRITELARAILGVKEEAA